MIEENKRALISALIDNELSHSEKEILLAEAEINGEIATEIERQRKFKEIIVAKYKRVPLPDESKSRILSALAVEMATAAKESETDSGNESTVITPISELNKKAPKQRVWLLVAAVTLLAALLYLSRIDNTTISNEFTSVEFISFQHFLNHNGLFVGRADGIDTTQDARNYLKEHYSCNITVPELDGVEFAGVLYVDFHDGYHTPLLSYRVNEDDYIYIFAFELKNLDSLAEIQRDPDAVRAIVRHNDVFTVTFNGHDVVSWKWDDVWYSAVSKHQGDVIAAMLPH
jgi:hypothetical protein